ncbi:MAG: KamA family radical SAM protein [Candidatus Zixiibacteriota bacterium]|nr:MAG: KamA family radical SAM protein [candidate division Zixibacteria bacterium]
MMEFNLQKLIAEGEGFIKLAGTSSSLEVVRERLFRRVTRYQFDVFDETHEPPVRSIVRVRDCTRAMRSILRAESDRMAGFSVTQALYDIANGKDRPDLQSGFYAELIHILMGMQGRGPGTAPSDIATPSLATGREAAELRSRELDRIWARVDYWMSRYEHGLLPSAIERRKKRKARICSALNVSDRDWNSWQWQVKNVVKRLDLLEKLVPLTDDEKENIAAALEAKLPFGVTPYYLSLMDDNCIGGDRTIRAQVFPPANYVREMSAHRGHREYAFDFMLEMDTSPIDLVVRRYPSIAILKPYNTCPQICVYCQRNWEIDTAMAPDALAPSKKINRAVEWIADHPAIHELLITGGDPFALKDSTIHNILEKVSKIESIDHIRLGSRTPVTIPMRITDSFVNMIKEFLVPGKRDVSLVTHFEHAYEVTPEAAEAITKFRNAGIPVYNQLVYTFFTSRRFESALLRKVLRRIGIEPYYAFNTKGKRETLDYIVPIARLLQEINEESRLLPGLTRTDEPVYNVPGLGKNYLRARHHRDLVSILPDGSRVYEFHPWDRSISGQKNYVGIDVPILSYLDRLEEIGEDISNYETIWYYY